MNKGGLKSILRLTGFHLSNQKKSIRGWALVIFFMMCMYMGLYDTMKEMTQMKMERMPSQFTDFFNMEDFSVMGTYIGFFGLIYNFILIPITIFAVTFTARIIIGEEKSKSIEFLYSMPFSRQEIFLSKILTSLVGVTVVVLAGGVATIGWGYFHEGSSLELFELVQVFKVSSFIPYFFAAVAIFMAGLSGKITSGATVSMVVIVSYFLGYLGKLLMEKGEWLLYLSPFELFEASKAQELSAETMAHLGIFFGLFLLLCLVGTYAYRKRDFNL